MKIWPAIDLLGGQAVRLCRGDYRQAKVYFSHPEEIRDYFERAGASCLHVVDLDGARTGEAVNFETIRIIANGSKLKIEVGGGIRSEERIKAYLDLGVSYVILGTAAVENPDFTRQMVEKYGSRIVVGVDALNGLAAVKGWKEVMDVTGLSLCQSLSKMGVSRIVYTDISKDGMMSGTNLDLYRELTEKVPAKITASGGITRLEEVQQLRKIGVDGVIIGKALYEGLIDLKEAIRVGEGTC